MTAIPDPRDERTQFEAWRRRTTKMVSRDDSIAREGFGDDANYSDRTTRSMWIGWQARASLQPVNGIKATMFHGEGAIAQCGYCKRYSLDPTTLSDRQPVCECGKKHGWSGSFKKPGPDAKWSGRHPASAQAGGEAVHVEAVATTVRDSEGSLRLDWLLEGGVAALECEGVVLYASDRPLTDENGSGEVYRIGSDA